MASYTGFGQHPPPCPWCAMGWQIYRNPTKPTSAWRLARGGSRSRQSCLSLHTLQCPAAWTLRPAHSRGHRTRALWLPSSLAKH
ncbi:mCG1048417 [Mus musculus]|nr:mCG1048417 [Mus musculus]